MSIQGSTGGRTTRRARRERGEACLRYRTATVQHRLSAEGADPLLLAGVNDSHLLELARVCGCRVVLRDDHLLLSGALEEVERVVPVAQHMIELARAGDAVLAPTTSRRFAEPGAGARGRRSPASPRAAASWCRARKKVIAAKSEGQREYLEAIEQQRHRGGHRPRRDGQDLPGRGHGGGRPLQEAREAHHPRPARRGGGREPRLPARATCRRRWIPYLRPLYDALEDMMGPERMRRALETRAIEIAPARLHARPHAARRLRHPGRGAERHHAPDEDVPHPPGPELQGGDHGRQDADRPAAPRRLGAARGGARPEGDRGDRLRLHAADRRDPPPAGEGHHPGVRAAAERRGRRGRRPAESRGR